MNLDDDYFSSIYTMIN